MPIYDGFLDVYMFWMLHVLYTDVAKIEDEQVQKPVAPPYSLNPSFNLAKNLTGSPQGRFIWWHPRVFLISFPSLSYGG
jgi:hypothetical protein